MRYHTLQSDAVRHLVEACQRVFDLDFDHMQTDATLGSGVAGLAFFFVESHRAFGRQDSWNSIERISESMVLHLQHTALLPGLYDGLVGVAWALEHCCRYRADVRDYAEPLLEQIDELLLEHVKLEVSRQDFDLVAGLVGVAAFALVRQTRVSHDIVTAVLRALCIMATRESNGTAWISLSDRTKNSERKPGLADDNFNLGLAHGVPGVVAFLAQCVRAATTDYARIAVPLLSEAVPWLLAQEQSGLSSLFSYYSNEKGTSRCAWCYGDPSVGFALAVAGASLKNYAWKRSGIRIAEHGLARSPESSGVVDSGLCHGAAGLALIGSQLYRLTGSNLFNRHAHTWAQRAIGFQVPSAFASNSTLGSAIDSHLTADASYLTGSSGVALALMTVTGFTQSNWVGPMLLNVEGYLNTNVSS